MSWRVHPNHKKLEPIQKEKKINQLTPIVQTGPSGQLKGKAKKIHPCQIGRRMGTHRRWNTFNQLAKSKPVHAHSYIYLYIDVSIINLQYLIGIALTTIISMYSSRVHSLCTIVVMQQRYLCRSSFLFLSLHIRVDSYGLVKYKQPLHTHKLSKVEHTIYYII